MKCTVIIGQGHKEGVFIYADKRTEEVDRIEKMLEEVTKELVGYKGDEIYSINPLDVFCFTVEEGRVYAHSDKGRLRMKCRLYTLEQDLNSSFVKINQSCIANVRKIEKFRASFSGTLMVEFKNGYKDYVSRRQMKIVKERLGI